MNTVKKRKNSGHKSKKFQRVQRAMDRQVDAELSGRVIKDKKTGKMRTPIYYTAPEEKTA